MRKAFIILAFVLFAFLALSACTNSQDSGQTSPIERIASGGNPDTTTPSDNATPTATPDLSPITTDFEYEINDGSVTITKYIGVDTDVVIPSTIAGYPVSNLGTTFRHNTSLTSVVIPDSIWQISGVAFEWCSALESVTLPDNLRGIGMNAFSGCESLTTLFLPDGVTELSTGAFIDCPNLTITFRGEPYIPQQDPVRRYDFTTLYEAVDRIRRSNIPNTESPQDTNETATQAPEQMQGLRIISIAASGNSTLALDEDGGLWAFGYNLQGQLGDGSTVNIPTPIKVMDNIASVSMHNSHALAVDTDGVLWAWGSNMMGQLGNGTTTDSPTPVKVMDNIVSISAGRSTSFAIDTNGFLWAWGANSYGQLGDGSQSDRLTPVKIMENVVGVSASVQHTVAIDTSGMVWAWGNRQSGRVGDGYGQEGITERKAPVRVEIGWVRVSIATGETHSLALDENGVVLAWGANSNGQIGDGFSGSAYNIRRFDPVNNILKDVTYIAAGGDTSFAIDKDGVLWAWGKNIYGQLGDGSNSLRSKPVKIMENAASVYAGGTHTFAIDRDGILWAWGVNDNGQLGDGTTESRRSPAQVIFK